VSHVVRGRGRRFAEEDGREIDWRAIDRALVDLVIARHGAPAPPPPMTVEEKERRVRQQKAERAMAAADPGFIRRVERHVRSGDALIRPCIAAAQGQNTRRPIGIDWEAAGLRQAGEFHELEPSEELHEALEHKTPQAFLRDLHRPVQMFGEVTLRRVRTPTSSDALGRARAVVREVMSHESVSISAIQLASRSMRRAVEEMRAQLARPWEESLPEKPLPLPTRTPGMHDMIWFGVSGGYDPDL